MSVEIIIHTFVKQRFRFFERLANFRLHCFYRLHLRRKFLLEGERRERYWNV